MSERKLLTSLVAAIAMFCWSTASAQQFDYYPWPDPEESVVVTTQDNDLWPISNLIQGPGVGYDEAEPNDQPGGGADTRWVTADDAGFPADYIVEVGEPVIQFDLGQDRLLKEISVWGYSGTNSNGTSQFSLRFATDAEGPDGLFGDIGYGDSISYNPTFELFSDPVPQQYKLFDEHVTARYVEFTNLDNFFIAPGTGVAPTEEFPERLLPVLPGGDRVGLGEVAFMMLPDSFMPGDKLPRKIGGDEFGVLEITATQSGQEFGPGGDFESGLVQEWFEGGNGGSKEGVDAIFAGTPVTDPFRAESGITWWSGDEAVSDVPQYPTEIEGLVGGDNYSVRLTGEILIEESGTIRFLDGVDDYTYLAIDTDRSGVAGDSAAEIIIDDNDWTSALSTGNGGAPIVEVDFDGIGPDGEWLAMEFNMSEGGGGDHGMLYWDADDEDGFFPNAQGEGVLDIDAAVFMIPDTNLRSQIRELVKANGDGSVATDLRQADVLELQVQVSPEGNDQIALRDVTAGEGVATLDVSGTTIRIVPDGDIAEGTEFAIFGADVVTGVEEMTLIFDGDAGMWNTSRLSEGILVFGADDSPTCAPNTGGDLDGNGAVEFADFLILSANFGQAVADHTMGDIDCDGSVQFSDFLVLSANFGQSIAAEGASVPEPSSAILLALGVMILGRRTKRRVR